MGWALIRGWALIYFFCLKDGCLFEVGANLRLGAYSNKYSSSTRGLTEKFLDFLISSSLFVQSCFLKHFILHELWSL